MLHFLPGAVRTRPRESGSPGSASRAVVWRGDRTGGHQRHRMCSIGSRYDRRHELGSGRVLRPGRFRTRLRVLLVAAVRDPHRRRSNCGGGRPVRGAADRGGRAGPHVVVGLALSPHALPAHGARHERGGVVGQPPGGGVGGSRPQRRPPPAISGRDLRCRSLLRLGRLPDEAARGLPPTWPECCAQVHPLSARSRTAASPPRRSLAGCPPATTTTAPSSPATSERRTIGTRRRSNVGLRSFTSAIPSLQCGPTDGSGSVDSLDQGPNSAPRRRRLSPSCSSLGERSGCHREIGGPDGKRSRNSQTA